MAITAWNNTADGEGEPSWASLAREFRASQMRFILHVPSWEAYKPLQVLQWDSIPYESKDLPVNKRGVYAFVLDIGVHSDSPLPPHACVLYVGETGDNGNATLASRLTNYRNKKAQRDRPQIWSMIAPWSSSLQFYYAAVRQSVSTKDCERTLLDALLPPVNINDFSAEVRMARQAAFS